VSTKTISVNTLQTAWKTVPVKLRVALFTRFKNREISYQTTCILLGNMRNKALSEELFALEALKKGLIPCRETGMFLTGGDVGLQAEKAWSKNSCANKAHYVSIFLVSFLLIIKYFFPSDVVIIRIVG
jgi:hypothetical protein